MGSMKDLARDNSRPNGSSPVAISARRMRAPDAEVARVGRPESDESAGHTARKANNARTTRAPPAPAVPRPAPERRARRTVARSVAPAQRAVRIFVSHSVKYYHLAKGVASALKSLQFQVPLEVLVCEEMQGGTEWLVWINRELRDADILLLLYPHDNMDMAWCSYEKGRFDRDDDRDRHRRRATLCIKNVDIPKPPPVFEQYQAYSANVPGIRKFLTELFAKGDFTGGEPINAEVDQVSSEYCKRADAAAADIAQLFARARVKDLLFERRIVIRIDGEDEQAGSTLDHATVEGNEGGLGLFDIAPQGAIGWRGFRERLKNAMPWPVDLENALPSIRSGLLPPSLSPFRASDGKIYLPVVPRCEMVAQKLREIVVIFVPADSDNLRRMLDWLPPAAMPDGWVGLVRLLKLMARARWETLEPCFQEAKFRAPDADRCKTLASSVLAGLTRLSADAENQGFNGISRFRAIFDVSMHGDLDRAGEEYLAAANDLRDNVVADATDLANKLARLLSNNAAYIQISSQQFSRLVGGLQSMTPHDAGA